MPLAELIRPTTLELVVGQTHILGKNKPLSNIMKSGTIPNMIFYGPSGVGKTTVASIIANNTNMCLHKLNGTSASTADIKKIISEINTFNGYNGILLYLDEIQYLNKKQQQSLLEYIETGEITLIASTTENPYFYIYNAILSRCTVFEFKPVSPAQLIPAVKRGFDLAFKQYSKELEIDENVFEIIAKNCGGDVRKALNSVEMCVLSCEKRVDTDSAKAFTQKSNMRYDKNGDEHYDVLSALQKSIRGSDENAALHYAARLIVAGDIISLCRRLLVIACEDIGLAYPNAIPIIKACVDSALQLGLPEARIPLADAIVLLCTSPKSNSAYLAMDMAIEDIKNGNLGEIPRHLQNKHFDGEGNIEKGQNYLYPHNYPNHYVKQQYLPNTLKNKVYYSFGDNKLEQAAKKYRENIKKSSE